MHKERNNLLMAIIYVWFMQEIETPKISWKSSEQEILGRLADGRQSPQILKGHDQRIWKAK